MKIVSTVVAIITAVGLWNVAHARYQRSVIDTNELAQETCTVKTVSTDQTAAVEVIALATALAGATYVELYNADTTNSINVGFTTSVSTQSANANYGREIVAQSGLGFAVNLDKIAAIYVGTQKTTGTTRVTITQCR